MFDTKDVCATHRNLRQFSIIDFNVLAHPLDQLLIGNIQHNENVRNQSLSLQGLGLGQGARETIEKPRYFGRIGKGS